MSTRTDRDLVLMRAAIDEGIAELDAGLGVETTPEKMMAEAWTEIAGVHAPRSRER